MSDRCQVEGCQEAATGTRDLEFKVDVRDLGFKPAAQHFRVPMTLCNSHDRLMTSGVRGLSLLTAKLSKL